MWAERFSVRGAEVARAPQVCLGASWMTVESRKVAVDAWSRAPRTTAKVNVKSIEGRRSQKGLLELEFNEDNVQRVRRAVFRGKTLSLSEVAEGLRAKRANVEVAEAVRHAEARVRTLELGKSNCYKGE